MSNSNITTFLAAAAAAVNIPQQTSSPIYSHAVMDDNSTDQLDFDEDFLILAADADEMTSSSVNGCWEVPRSSFVDYMQQNGEGYVKTMEMDDHVGFKIAFRTKSDLEIMDDGYKWRKYGKKRVKNNPNPRNYYRCSTAGCKVKKRVERDKEDPRFVITTYEGKHHHESPSADTDICHNAINPDQRTSHQLQFLHHHQQHQP
ncbi:PREDICTED: probable WRKY transcription factor 71 isoform X2 [Theobroma cacao]|uniref:Probable WRKY transcription factor 71 isoform X2 n=1 Tax=Theobroma cacao TaxID=3641 RepID=A0AB32WPS0_THECC|nr:PREDICTED: probable WRKY transcription factor 71 isoform X2 [Theobroma cacao]